uniref:Protein-serine O-palmitoleoyltransferase porcupine n=1 Tax=Phallusia mammillata TaxID=59560 RepID=A0A6F9DNN5_9ASCI|nr:protein-cysteine N-palmitoyltransferase porcupine [Phallusia mammillata]
MAEFSDDNYAYHNDLQNSQFQDYEYMDEEDYSLSYAQHNVNLQELVEQRLQKHSTQDEFHHLRSNCLGTTLKQAVQHAFWTVVLCLFLRCLLYAVQRKQFTLKLFHFGSIFCGIIVIHNVYTDIFQIAATVFGAFSTVLYAINLCSQRRQWRSGLLTSLAAVFCIVFGELLFSDPHLWNRLRGVLLLVAMKIISVAFDFETKRVAFPGPLLYFSYIFHPGFLVYGPWISIEDYQDYLTVKRPFNFDWLKTIIKSAIQASICLVLSVCVVPYLFIDPLQPYNPALFPFVGNKWFLSYCTAVSFHFSHYYICYLSVLTSVVSGVGGVAQKQTSKKTDDPQPKDFSWTKYKVVMPTRVEIPRSMVSVVVAWNIPMSKWLKKYVFDSSRYLGDFPAILFTYIASAMLHGLSLHLAAVLLSLGFYTYTEHALRQKLSKAFNCPAIQARPPKASSEKQPPTPLWATFFNVAWVFINLMHLAYLGSLFESGNEEEETSGLQFTLSKWGELHYFSHLFALGCFIINCLI